MTRDEKIVLVAKAIWAERVRHAKEGGIDLEAYAETTGFRIPEADEPTVADMNNILGEARVAIESFETATLNDAFRDVMDEKSAK